MLISINTDLFKLNLSHFSVMLIGYITTISKNKINISKTINILHTTKNELFKSLQELNESNILNNKIDELKDQIIIEKNEDLINQTTINNDNLKTISQQNLNVGKNNKKRKISHNTEKINHICERIITFLNTLMNKHINPKGSTVFKLTKHLIDEGYTEDNLIEVISKKYIEWSDWSEYKKFMVPGTLFKEKNFDKYLSEPFIKNDWKFNNIKAKLPDMINNIKETYQNIYHKSAELSFLKDHRLNRIVNNNSPFNEKIENMDIKEDDNSLDDIMNQLSNY